jgi:preprotein translocase subunit SecA
MDAGGLFIVGTERHESRRIDNQLRGRAGRQGDPGASRFFLSAEDDLVRLFAGDRIYKILDRLGTVDEHGHEEPIEAGMLSKQIEKAQKKVEEQNFLIRKRVLEYDDVMNEQRRIVYAYRDQVLEGREMGDTAREELERVVRRTVDEYTPGDYLEDWDLQGLGTAIDALWPLELDLAALGKQQGVDREELIRLLHEDAIARYDAREEELGEELMRSLERYLLLDIIDTKWREHLYDMDYLREGIHLRGFAQIEPIIAYKNEAYSLFTDLMNSMWTEFARLIFNVQVQVEIADPAAAGGGGTALEPAQAPGPSRPGRSSTTGGASSVTYSGGAGAAQPSALAAAAGAAATSPDGFAPDDGTIGTEPALPLVETRHVPDEQQIGRNDPCWCGSGKKFKRCHGA